MNVDVGISGEKVTEQGRDMSEKYEKLLLYCLTAYCDNVGMLSVVSRTFHSYPSLLYLILALFRYFFHFLSLHIHS